MTKIREFSNGLVALTAGLLLATCASTDNTQKIVEIEHERIRLLEEALQNEKEQVKRLQTQLTELSEKKPPSVPVEHLVPARPDASDVVNDEEDSSIADSSHETMHWYFQGLRLMQESKYEEAIRNFREFVRSSPSHIYADRADYLIAENHFHNKEYGLSLVAFKDFEKKYAESFRLPEALYHEGLSYAAVGEREEAKKILRTLLKQFPGHLISEKTSKKLAELGAPPKEKEIVPLLGDLSP